MDELEKLKHEYLISLPDRLLKIKTFYAKNATQDLISEVHKIGGSAGLFGLHELSEKALFLEENQTDIEIESFLNYLNMIIEQENL